MDKNKFSQLGWVAALIMGGVLIGGGFQGATTKLGVADIGKVAEGSEYYTTNAKTFDTLVKTRQELLKFFDQYLVLTTAQTDRIKELWLKDKATPQETAELERLKGDVMAQDKRQKELSLKTTSLTPEERTVLDDFGTRARTMREQTLPRLNEEFNADIQQKKDQIQQTAFEKARTAIRAVGKEQGYTVVMSSAAAPYAANDITEDAVKAMNAQK